MTNPINLTDSEISEMAEFVATYALAKRICVLFGTHRPHRDANGIDRQLMLQIKTAKALKETYGDRFDPRRFKLEIETEINDRYESSKSAT